MSKTKEELNELKEEVEALNKKLHELTDEELAQVTGGGYNWQPHDPGRDLSSPCSERNHLRVSTACLNPPCSKLCNNKGYCTCADGAYRGNFLDPDSF